jgi:DNA-binding transcriptional regulator YiaG
MSKRVKTIIYEGLGFPIQLQNVEMIEIDGEWHPKIDVKKVANCSIKALLSQKQRLTGNQVKFIRHYLSMSLRKFAEEVVYESHTAVSKWEKRGNLPTRMDINIEKMLRLYMYEKVNMNTVQQKRNFYDKYLEVRELNAKDDKVDPIQISGCELRAG